MPAYKAVTQLLDEVQKRAELDYLSDLHDARQVTAVARAVEDIAPDAYPAEVWASAASYILQTQEVPLSREGLLARLRS